MDPLNRFEVADHRAVEVARHYYEETKKNFIVSIGRFSGWDCRSSDDTIRIEVKCEDTPRRTGNVCIEYWNSHLDEPSGVLSTQANLWVHIIPDGEGFIAIEYDVERLRKLIVENGTLNSNGHDSMFKLIPVGLFKANAKRLFKFESRFMNGASNQR